MTISNKAKAGVGLTALLVLPVLPTVALEPLGLGGGTGAWALAAIATALATILVTPAVGVRASLLLAAFATLGFAASSSPWAAALVMAAGAAVYGRSARWGLTSAVVMAPIGLGFIMSERQQVLGSQPLWANAAVVGVIALAAGLWGVVVGGLIGRQLPRKPGEPLSVPRATAFAAMIALITGAAMGVVTALDLGHTGGWVLLTLFVVIQPSLHDTWVKSLHRLLGTLLGFLIAFVVGELIHPTWALYLVAVACMVGAAMVRLTPGRPYWLFATFLTPAVVLIEGAGGSVLATDQARLGATLAGGAVALAAVALLAPISRRVEARGAAKPESPHSAAT